MWSGAFGLADTAPYFLIRFIHVSHRCISSFRSTFPQVKVLTKNPLLGIIPNQACDLSLSFHIQQHILKVFPICHVVQRALKNKNYIYNYNVIMICKVYIFESYKRHKNKFYLNNRRGILRKSWSYCITVLKFRDSHEQILWRKFVKVPFVVFSHVQNVYLFETFEWFNCKIS